MIIEQLDFFIHNMEPSFVWSLSLYLNIELSLRFDVGSR